MFAATHVSTEKMGCLIACEIAAHHLGAGTPLPGLGSAAAWGGHTCGTKAWLPEGDRIFLF